MQRHSPNSDAGECWLLRVQPNKLLDSLFLTHNLSFVLCFPSHCQGGKLRLPHESIEKTIESNKLRITLNRRNCLNLDNRDCIENRPPMADYPNYSSTTTHFSDLLNVDVKLPGEHYLDGQSFDAELQLLHIHLESSRMSSIGVPIKASPNAHNVKFQLLLDEFQLVYDRHQAECDAKQANGRRSLRAFHRIMMENKEQESKAEHRDTAYSTLLDDPDLQRRLQEERTTLFDPYTDFLKTVYFYRYVYTYRPSL